MKTARNMGLVIIMLLVVVVSMRADFSNPNQAANWTAVSPATWSISSDSATGTLGLSGGTQVTGRGYVYYELTALRDETVNLTITGNANDFLYATWQTAAPVLTSGEWHSLPRNSATQFSVSQGYYFGFQINKTQVGNRTFNITGFNVTLAPVPEPATYAMASGLALIGFVAYRRFRRMPAAI